MDIICTYFCIFNQEDLHRGAFVQCKCMRVHWDLLSSETNKLTSRTLDSFERKRNKLKHAHPCDAPCGHHTFLSLFCLRSRSGKHLITPKTHVMLYMYICKYAILLRSTHLIVVPQNAVISVFYSEYALMHARSLLIAYCVWSFSPLRGPLLPTKLKFPKYCTVHSIYAFA